MTAAAYCHVIPVALLRVSTGADPVGVGRSLHGGIGKPCGDIALGVPMMIV
jgi:hypothetical protein